ncbi:MAG: glycine cleavage system protein GcvH [Chloroflexota bacterium]|nr:glycine cleavage system protein GcvH [Dehalococcoidia bacterium]MEC8909583.1 glycine cleavage system protein GcvH [Chloroflexota bacterium]MCS5670143.1 glycine cleavage system protein GcvH [Dehalococcoidia bacterium]MEC8959277.1 glycine cleavage system protein GcvH [Chloroflexota bacterium]MEC9271934.1 glycine cleavage system protein GcvH [Chloroflexota bacterium]
MSSPDDRRYTQEHEWVMIDATATNTAVAGITDYAQDQLGDIVYFELPKVGDDVAHLGKMGEVESVKAVSDLFSPIDGVVTEINEKLLDHPELVNEDPFGEGWLIKATIADAATLDILMSAADYDAFIAGL